MRRPEHWPAVRQQVVARDYRAERLGPAPQAPAPTPGRGDTAHTSRLGCRPGLPGRILRIDSLNSRLFSTEGIPQKTYRRTSLRAHNRDEIPDFLFDLALRGNRLRHLAPQQRPESPPHPVDGRIHRVHFDALFGRQVEP